MILALQIGIFLQRKKFSIRLEEALLNTQNKLSTYTFLNFFTFVPMNWMITFCITTWRTNIYIQCNVEAN